MRALTPAAVCLSVLALVPAAVAANRVRGAAPTRLHGFLLRADEPVENAFPRTPSFAWDPVPGAVRYQFQLATSSSFRESGIVYSVANLATPVAAPNVTLPWISGSPHALFARVRAIKRSPLTPWSAPFGFDMEPTGAPKPLPSEAGLLRWTPALGASVYEVQWSKKRYPFKPEPNPQNDNALGTMTLGTSAVLPLKAGTWYYRVRGFNYTLPTGAQQMSWSDPAKIVVAKPKFRVVGGGK